MTKSVSYAVLGFAMLASTLAPTFANAQTAMATMPVLYNQSGQAMNMGSAPLPAGTYYLASNGTQPVSYYGNGTYYNAATGMYGGSAVNDPSGTANVSLGYSTAVNSPVSVIDVPLAPNTGAGGGAAATWVTLGLAALAFAVGARYLVKKPQVNATE